VTKFASPFPSLLDVDPMSIIFAADEVLSAIALAFGGKGWL
jgi:hypothetical protein